ncbi:hypothetical protein GCM10022393_27250 [Aquimarina addita]|uniref:Secretion system C-terminal sorting domain-containing protein n=1 Tax=Aquimarina addita TaxID=870485 RepID=A0ABP6UPT9_9FLAO
MGLNTYEDINAVLAPISGDVIEAPGVTGTTCDNHSTYVGTDGNRHIDEVFDADLGINVFRFIIHVNEDIDRDKCSTTDRQRNEIKTYDQSPDNLLGIEGETVQYKWKFKLDAGFQGSGSFTHLHQLKAVGGSEEGTPLITLTARENSNSRLELRYAQQASQATETSIELSLIKGNWISVEETVLYGETGTYNIVMTNTATGVEIMNHTINDRMWKTDADFVRPKWGIYRSLNSASDLRDEEVLFANFSIEENPTLSIGDLSKETLFNASPNPTTGKVDLKLIKNINNYSVTVTDINGKTIRKTSVSDTKTVDLSDQSNGIYFFTLVDKTTNMYSVVKVLKQ